MKQFSSTVAKIKNASGQYEPIPALRGQSPYEIAVQNGYDGTEEEWMAAVLGDGWIERCQELEAQIATKADKSEVPSPAQIIVSTREGGNVACVLEDGTNVEPIAQGTEWIFPAAWYGTYTITGTWGVMTRIKTVEVTAMQQYSIELEWYEDNFADNDWDVIADVIESGITPETWSVGDSKEITTLDESSTYTIRIIGKEHDVYENGDVAPFTFAIDRVASGSGLKYCVMHTTATNDGGWSNTEIRQVIIPDVIATLPIADKIQTVKKSTSAGNMSTEIITSYDKGFLLSEVECIGACENSVVGEGSQYEYFTAGNTIFSDNEYTNDDYWTRSPAANNATDFVRIRSNGNSMSSGTVAANVSSVALECTITFAFCL